MRTPTPFVLAVGDAPQGWARARCQQRLLRWNQIHRLLSARLLSITRRYERDIEKATGVTHQIGCALAALKAIRGTRSKLLGQNAAQLRDVDTFNRFAKTHEEGNELRDQFECLVKQLSDVNKELDRLQMRFREVSIDGKPAFNLVPEATMGRMALYGLVVIAHRESPEVIPSAEAEDPRYERQMPADGSRAG